MTHDPLADALRAPALIEAPESVDRHDPTTTHAFERIFSHPSNAEIARAITVGLAINDPAKPVEETPKERASAATSDGTSTGTGVGFATVTQAPGGFSMEGLAIKDSDGDELRIAHVFPNTDDEHKERVTFVIGGKVVALTLEAAEEVADFLDGVLDDEGDEVDA